MISLDAAALIVVDPQNGFLNQHSRPVLPRLAELISRWRERGGSLLVTRYHNYSGSPYERLLDWHEVYGPPDTDICPEIAPHAAVAEAVVDKTGYTALNDDTLTVIGAHGWTDLVFCGLDTDTCVLKSAADAFDLGFTPWLAADACASHGSVADHDRGLLMISRIIGERQVLHADDILRRLR